MYRNFLQPLNCRKLLCVVFSCLYSFFTYSQHAGYTRIADLESFKKQFSIESAKVMSIKSPFIQEKVLLALTEKITSKGTFWFKRSNKVRIEYNTPFEYQMVINGDKVLIRDSQKENHVNVNSNKLFQQVNRIMIDCVQGTILDSKDFTSVVYENENTYQLEMTPTSKILSGFFQMIILKVDKKDYSASSIEMNEPSGDMTIIRFTNKQINAEVSDTVFAL
jgi:outer membrane lipoprotein-sorting protein